MFNIGKQIKPSPGDFVFFIFVHLQLYIWAHIYTQTFGVTDKKKKQYSDWIFHFLDLKIKWRQAQLARGVEYTDWISVEG